MEALDRPPQAAEVEPRLLLEWPSEQRRLNGWICSLFLHAAGLTVLALLPHGIAERTSVAQWRTVTPLIAPPSILTQREPNRGKIGKEFTLENLRPRPRIFIPPGPPASTRTAARGAPAPEQKPPAALPEPPKVESSSTTMAQALPLGSGSVPAPPPPQIQVEEKPKLAFETPGAPSGAPRQRGLSPRTLAPPNSSVSEAVRSAIRQGAGGVVVGDLDLPGPGGLGPGLNLPSAPGARRSTLEMLSDPMGVDFKPYLVRILAMVKLNWLNVIPESARLGRTGRVQIQFAIARDGRVPKLVIAMPSGTDALDRAAVAGVSASTPFPPLPGSFQGDQIRLQFTFSYNMR